MSGPILARNLITSSATVRAGTVADGQAVFTATDASDPLFPVANLYAGRQSLVWKASSTGGPWAIDIDFGAATSIDFGALHNHSNISRWRVYSSATGLLSGWTERHDDETPRAVSSYGTWTSASARYWRFLLTVDVGAYATIGELVLDAKTQLSRQFIWGATIGREWNSSASTTIAGNTWSRDHGTDRRTWSVTWRGLTESEKGEFDTFFALTKGSVYPFTIAPYPDVPESGKDDEVYFVRLPRGFSYVDVHTLSKEIAGVELIEEPLDVEVAA
jgi:hypothetical protein